MHVNTFQSEPESPEVFASEKPLTSRSDMDQTGAGGQEHLPKCEINSLAKKTGRFRHASGECLRHNSGEWRRTAAAVISKDQF